MDKVRVCLVFPSYQSFVDPVSYIPNKIHMGRIPPLSLGYVAALFERCGCSVQLLDASVLGMSKNEVVKHVCAFRPHLLGFTVSTIDFPNTLRWIAYLKNVTKSHTIVGGIQLSVYPDETMLHECIDFALCGDAEETIQEFVEAYRSTRSYAHIKGLIYKEHGVVVKNEKREPTFNLDAYPHPARHLMPLDKYYSFISHAPRFTAMLTSRGCPYACTFCDNKTIPYRAHSPEYVVDEIEECVKKYHIGEIDIYDALFPIDKQRVFRICELMRKRDISCAWSFRSRIDLVDEETLAVVREAGCYRIYYGVESGDETIVKNIQKNIDMKHVAAVVSCTKKYNIQTFGYFMIGSPGETRETIKKTMAVMLSMPFDHVQISPVFAPPRTRLYEAVCAQVGYDFWRHYTMGDMPMKTFPRYGTTLTNAEVHRAVTYGYIRFYMRTHIWWKFVRENGSFKRIVLIVHALCAVLLMGMRLMLQRK